MQGPGRLLKCSRDGLKTSGHYLGLAGGAGFFTAVPHQVGAGVIYDAVPVIIHAPHPRHTVGGSQALLLALFVAGCTRAGRDRKGRRRGPVRVRCHGGGALGRRQDRAAQHCLLRSALRNQTAVSRLLSAGQQPVACPECHAARCMQSAGGSPAATPSPPSSMHGLKLLTFGIAACWIHQHGLAGINPPPPEPPAHGLCTSQAGVGHSGAVLWHTAVGGRRQRRQQHPSLH